MSEIKSKMDKTTPGPETPLPFGLKVVATPYLKPGHLYIAKGDGWEAMMREMVDAANSLPALSAENARLRASCEELLAVVRIQNGNLHADTNAIQKRASAALSGGQA